MLGAAKAKVVLNLIDENMELVKVQEGETVLVLHKDNEDAIIIYNRLRTIVPLDSLDLQF